MINRYSPEKIYRQIANAIEADIQDAFEPGDLYPSEKILTDRFAVNRHTVRRAVEELVKQGVLEKRHGLGTFIAEKRLAYSVKGDQRFTESVQVHDLQVESLLVDKKIIAARGGIAEKLQLKNGAEVFQIDTLRKIEGKEAALISHFLPKDICPTAFAKYESGSLGEFLKAECGIQTKRVSSLVSATRSNEQDSFRLGMSSNRPILKVKTINEDTQTGKRVEYSITRFRSDMIQLEILMNA
ncbi:transcriptional regulator, GntR family [Psychromonas ingrahamii 37]|uniref:Transcriptional regulator, GntR family n=1 Tax=Psychromonas ingrahamii (strain DSM 17664 / CCUG 51855 / 37) TaxID=357804 RepID=A1T0V8_PSYIN|nr:phosphonate metabolism transcriptional regulator PhnF [Psychromonas ingrahamii]ABM05373.1 transcriptional regulator, GntR family [Psychromonas ingrahamii 37]